MDILQYTIPAVVATLTGGIVWVIQQRYEILFSTFKELLFIIPKAKSCYSVWGDGDSKEDLNSRINSFSENSEQYMEKIEKLLATLKLFSGTKELQNVIYDYYRWKTGFIRNLLKYKIKVHRKGDIVDIQEYFWDADSVEKNRILKIEKKIERLIPVMLNFRILFFRILLEIFWCKNSKIITRKIRKIVRPRRIPRV